MFKYLFFTTFFSALCFASMAQVSYSPMNKDNFNEVPFEFKGKRVMTGDRVDNTQSKNIFLFTKDEQGIHPDRLYAQQFEKVDEVWVLKKDTIIVSEQTLSLWGSRKGFFNSEDGKNLVCYFIYSEGNPDNNTTNAVSLLAFYNGNLYSLTENTDRETTESINFKDLPMDVKAKLSDYWNKLDKWK